jgi:hypothetical protein
MVQEDHTTSRKAQPQVSGLLLSLDVFVVLWYNAVLHWVHACSANHSKWVYVCLCLSCSRPHGQHVSVCVLVCVALHML